MTVCAMDTRDNSYRRLYDGMGSIEDTELLAQFAMNQKGFHELIFIFPGFNRGINEIGEYKKAVELDRKFRQPVQDVCRGRDRELASIKEKMHKYIDAL